MRRGDVDGEESVGYGNLFKYTLAAVSAWRGAHRNVFQGDGGR
jgi:hypothetical protein